MQSIIQSGLTDQSTIVRFSFKFQLLLFIQHTFSLMTYLFKKKLPICLGLLYFYLIFLYCYYFFIFLIFFSQIYVYIFLIRICGFLPNVCLICFNNFIVYIIVQFQFSFIPKDFGNIFASFKHFICFFLIYQETDFYLQNFVRFLFSF